MQVPLQPGLTARDKPRLVLFDDQHPAPQLCGGSDAWCWTGDEIAAVAIRRPDSHDIAAVAEQAYREAWQQLSANGHAHWLRTWTYFDDILQGEGDAERYRRAVKDAEGAAANARETFENELAAARKLAALHHEGLKDAERQAAQGGVAVAAMVAQLDPLGEPQAHKLVQEAGVPLEDRDAPITDLDV